MPGKGPGKTSVRARVVALSAAVVVSAGACGGVTSSSQSLKVEATPVAIRKAAEATLAKSPTRLDFTVTMPIAGHDVKMTGKGKLDSANRRVEMTIDASALMDGLGAGSSMPAEMAAMFKEMTVVLDGTVMYMKFPMLSQLGMGSKSWIKFDLAKAGSGVSELLGGGAGSAFGSDPSAFVQFLAGAGAVTKVGEAQVQGLKTTHFSGTYTMRQAMEQVPADRRDKLRSAISSLGIPDSALDTPIPFEVWVDREGLVRRMQSTIDMASFQPDPAKATSLPIGKMTMTVELSGFGEPVSITVPSDAEVEDLSAFLSGMTRTEKFSSVGSSIN